MSRIIHLVVLAAFLYLPVGVKATPVVLIDFDSPLPDLGLSQGVILGTPLIINGDKTGIITTISIRSSPSAVSPPNAAFPFPTNPLIGGVNGIEGEFFFNSPDSQVPLFATTRFVSFNVVGSQGPWTVLFFDITNTKSFDIQTGLIGMITGNTDQLVSFSFAGGIHRFVLMPPVVNGSTGIDNLQFEATAVPEPSALLLLTLGIGGLFARKRRMDPK